MAAAMTATKNKKVLPQGVGVVVVGHPPDVSPFYKIVNFPYSTNS